MNNNIYGSDGKSVAAIILAAGVGKRMNSDVPKQYMLIHDKPVLYHTIKAFEESMIDKIVLVVGAGDEEYARDEYINRYGFKKIASIVVGGKERYNSVYNGLMALDGLCDYVFIHDGARPVVYQDMLQRILEAVIAKKAVIAGMPVKDTIKIADEQGVVTETPDRKKLFMIQTPQAFEYSLIKDAYTKLMDENGISKVNGITDDAMVVEAMTNSCVHIVEGSYKNIKITTPDDLILAETFLIHTPK